MNQLQKDFEKLSEIVRAVSDHSITHLNRLDQFQTGSRAEYHPGTGLPEHPLGAMATLEKFKIDYEKYMVSAPGPRYFGFVTGGVTPAALAGDWLTSVYDQNPQSTEGEGDVSARIEMDTVRLLLDLFQLPDRFTGGFVTGATMSNFAALATARQWAGMAEGHDTARFGIRHGIPVLAATPHSSSIKALAMLGMGSANFIQVKTLDGREAMDTNDLELELSALKDKPAIVISSGGTVNTVDFDDMEKIAALKHKYNFWWHIDAAFGGFVACSPQYRPLLAGWENADSITIDGHKWLNVPYDSAIVLTNKQHLTQQLQTFQNSNAPYLGDAADKFSYLNFLPENSRRLRALPAWFTLIAYGRQGYQNIVEKNIAQAHQLAAMVVKSANFDLMNPVRVNVVAFTFKSASLRTQKTVNAFLKIINDSAKVFITPTTLQGTLGFRAAFVNWRTEAKDVDLLMSELEGAIGQL